ncbi:MAG: hypothetical protein ACRD0K_16765 [Egibacteraceae bacterium]
MADAHAHDWIDIGGGATACAVKGCQALRHAHQHSQDTRGQWLCAYGSWTPQPSTPHGQVSDLSGCGGPPAQPAHSALLTGGVVVMAVAITPERAQVCAQVCAHDDRDAVRAIVATACALCGEPIGHGPGVFHDTGWRHLAHQDRALADLDPWTALGPEGSSR